MFAHPKQHAEILNMSGIADMVTIPSLINDVSYHLKDLTSCFRDNKEGCTDARSLYLVCEKTQKNMALGFNILSNKLQYLEMIVNDKFNHSKNKHRHEEMKKEFEVTRNNSIRINKEIYVVLNEFKEELIVKKNQWEIEGFDLACRRVDCAINEFRSDYVPLDLSGHPKTKTQVESYIKRLNEFKTLLERCTVELKTNRKGNMPE